jgi:hypothetical protein
MSESKLDKELSFNRTRESTQKICENNISKMTLESYKKKGKMRYVRMNYTYSKIERQKELMVFSFYKLSTSQLHK